MTKVLFICHGNICRSPMAQYVFEDMVKKQGIADLFEIDSAATSREEIGNGVHHGTRRKLAKMGRTIIVITHDAECALACCERAIRLENGCITDDFQIRGAELLLDKIGYDKKEG